MEERGRRRTRRTRNTEYFEKQEKIRSQTITKERYDAVEQEIGRLEEKISELNAGILSCQQSSRLRKNENVFWSGSAEAERKIEDLKRQEEDLARLTGFYKVYLESRAELLKCRDKMEATRQDQERSRQLCDKLEAKEKSLEGENGL